VGEWLATVRFPDGSSRYARYSTVVESVLSSLYPSVEYSYGRQRPSGEPTDGLVGAAPAPASLLVRVLITVEPDDVSWHAFHDPARDVLLGPHSSHHRISLQYDYSLRSDISGMRHLSEGASRALCGVTADGPELPFRRSHPLGPSVPNGSDISDSPEVDLFAEDAAGVICRDCLVATL
jgi:hypothetical protein